MAQSNARYFSDGYGTHGYRAEMYLWYQNIDEYRVRLHVAGGAQLYNSDGWNGSYINFAGYEQRGNCAGGPTDYYWKNSNWYWNDIDNGILYKGHEWIKVERTCVFNYGGKGNVVATETIWVEPKPYYNVSYDANGGTGAPASQTKWHGETLGLRTGIPFKSGFAFKGWKGSDGGTYGAGANYYGNTALTLTAIWEALTTDLEEIEDCEIGQAPTIAWTPQSASLIYNLILSLGDWSYSVEGLAPGSTDRYVFDTYTLPMEICSQIPDSADGLMKVELETYNAGDLTGVSERYFTVYVPDTVVPVISAVNLTDLSNNALGVLLQNYSYLNVDISFSAAYDSEIASVKLDVGDQSQTIEPSGSPANLTTDILMEPGSVDLTVTITDRRGRTDAQTQTLYVNEYMLPTVEVEVALEGTNTVKTTIRAGYSPVGGANSAVFSVNGGEPRTVVNGETVVNRFVYEYAASRNYRCDVIVTDAITSVSASAWLYPGRGNRFSELDSNKYYIGIDEFGWQDTDSVFSGGISDTGVIWAERESGNGPTGLGFPIRVEPDSMYEFLYSADEVDSDSVAIVSFFSDKGTGELGYSYMGTVYNGGHITSGAFFRTPELDSGALWAMVILGVLHTDAPINYQEFEDVVVRKVDREEEALEWVLETGNLGLDSPLQKYISRIQMRIDYSGSLKVEISYDEDAAYKVVHESVSDHMRSITVPVKVKRTDHFRIRLSGVGHAKLYSMGYEIDEGGARCLV